MLNRLILNLIQGANQREDSEFRTRTGLEPPMFAAGPILGNIGGPFRAFPDDMDSDEVDAENSHIDVYNTDVPLNTNGTAEVNVASGSGSDRENA